MQDNVLLVAGVVCIIAAVAGGGLKAFAIEVPVLKSTARQAAIGIVGIALLSLGLHLGSTSAPRNPPVGAPPSAPPRRTVPAVVTALPPRTSQYSGYYSSPPTSNTASWLSRLAQDYREFLSLYDSAGWLRGEFTYRTSSGKPTERLSTPLVQATTLVMYGSTPVPTSSGLTRHRFAFALNPDGRSISVTMTTEHGTAPSMILWRWFDASGAPLQHR